MKTLKHRHKQVMLLKHELRRIYSRTTSLIIRKSVTKARTNLKSILEALNDYDTDIVKLKNDVIVLKSNNIGLARGIQGERENSKSLLQDKIVAEASYQDLFKEHVILKKELWNVEQILLSYDDELKNAMIPNLVKLSDDITNFKLRSNIIRKNIETKRSNDTLPRNTWSSSINFGTNLSQPVSTVNPMVKGYVIQKPTINVRRMSLPRDENRNSLFANVDIASPIMEEPEEIRDHEETLSPVNNSSNRRCKNGLRQMIHLSNGQTGRRPTQPIPGSDLGYCDTLEETDNGIDFSMEPVVRLKDVTRLLQHSTLRISERDKRSSPAEENFSVARRNSYSPEVLLKRIATPKPTNFESSVGNSLEGCSWMYQCSPSNAYRDSAEHVSPRNRQRRSASVEHSLPVGRRLSIFNINSSGEQRDSCDEHDSPRNELPISNSRKSSSAKASSSFSNENGSPPKMERSKKMETTFLTSTLNSSALLKSTKKRFFSNYSGPEEDNFTELGDGSGDRNVAARCVNDESECTSTSTQGPDSNAANSPRLSLLLQNCTMRRRGRPSKARQSTLLPSAKTDEGLSEANDSSEAEDGHKRTSKAATSSDEVSSQSARPVRASKHSKRINYSEMDAYKEREAAPTKPKRSRKRIGEITNHDVPVSGIVSSTERRRAKKSRNLVDDSGSEQTSRSGSNLSLNDITQEFENTRPLRASRNRANVSYKEPSIATKLRREH